jgi:hypothetical protein
MTFQHARELLSAEGGDPRIVLAASLLLEIAVDRPDPGGRTAAEVVGRDSAARARKVLGEIGLDANTIECVCHVIHGYWTGAELDTVEFNVVSDAHALTELASACAAHDRSPMANRLQQRLRTEAGRRKAESLR